MLGKILDRRYQIEKELGKGSFGETYLAKDLRMANPNKSKCVVKKLQPYRQDIFDKAKNSFYKEAAILRDLKHPQIPSFLAYFQEEDSLYLVQEYIDGHDFRQEILSGKPWQENEVIILLRDILEFIQFLQ